MHTCGEISRVHELTLTYSRGSIIEVITNYTTNGVAKPL